LGRSQLRTDATGRRGGPGQLASALAAGTSADGFLRPRQQWWRRLHACRAGAWERPPGPRHCAGRPRARRCRAGPRGMDANGRRHRGLAGRPGPTRGRRAGRRPLRYRPRSRVAGTGGGGRRVHQCEYRSGAGAGRPLGPRCRYRPCPRRRDPRRPHRDVHCAQARHAHRPRRRLRGRARAGDPGRTTDPAQRNACRRVHPACRLPATAPAHAAMLNLVHPELMSHAVAGVADLPPLLERASVLALGPGLGHGEWSQALWQVAIDTAKPLVVDADGLNLLATAPRRFAAPVVMTPHPGEAARLLGSNVDGVEADRYAAVRELARRYAAVVVLKGAGSLVADTSGRVAVCPWGNPGMAAGGMGDLLTGIVVALLAQGCVPWEAACLGVGLHARAGDLAARDGERGMLPTDLLQPLRRLGNADTG